MKTEVKETKIERMVITPEELMKTYGFGRNMVYENLLKRPGFPCFRIGKKYYINVSKLGEWFDKQCEEK